MTNFDEEHRTVRSPSLGGLSRRVDMSALRPALQLRTPRSNSPPQGFSHSTQVPFARTWAAPTAVAPTPQLDDAPPMDGVSDVAMLDALHGIGLPPLAPVPMDATTSLVRTPATLDPHSSCHDSLGYPPLAPDCVRATISAASTASGAAPMASDATTSASGDKRMTASKKSGPASKWSAGTIDADGSVLWRHPSGAEKRLASTLKPAARRMSLSRALKEHERPVAAKCARQAHAHVMAQKRTNDAAWRERERQADAQATAHKRASDPEWRERERQADAQAKAWKTVETQVRQQAEARLREAREVAMEKAKRRQRRALRIDLMDRAGLSSQTHGLVELLAKVWACEWPACVLNSPADLQMVDLLELDDAEYVMNLANHCSEYIEYVESLDESTEATLVANAQVDRVWFVRAHSVSESDRQRFIGLTLAEARALDTACMDWINDYVEWHDEPEAELARLLDDSEYSSWACAICGPGCAQPTFSMSLHRWSCEQCNWEWNVCAVCSGNDYMRSAAQLRSAGLPVPAPPEVQGHHHRLTSLEHGHASTGEPARLVAARCKGLPFVKAKWVNQPIPKPPKQYHDRWCCTIYKDEGCDCWGCRWAEASPCLEAVRRRERAAQCAAARLRAAAAEQERLERPLKQITVEEARRGLKRACEETEAKLSPTKLALSHAKRARDGCLDEMTKRERQERESRIPLVVRIQAFARDRRVRSLTRRRAAEEAAAKAERASAAVPVPVSMNENVSFEEMRWTYMQSVKLVGSSRQCIYHLTKLHLRLCDLTRLCNSTHRIRGPWLQSNRTGRVLN